MKTSRLLFLACTFLAFNSVQAQVPLAAEPASMTLEINGELYQLAADEEIQLEGTFENPTVKLSASDLTFLDAESIRFSYPTYYAFEYDGDFSFRSWTLDGNDFVIMYFVMDSEASLEDFVDEMVASFGKKNCDVSKINKTLGDRRLSGQKIEVELAGQLLDIELLNIHFDDYKSRIIIFQDLLDEDGSHSQESLETMQIINETFEYNEGE